MSELDDFGQMLMREVRDRAIRELFDRLTGSGDETSSDESLRHLSSGADAEAMRDVILTAVDGAIAGFLFFMDAASTMETFEVFSPTGDSVAAMSDGIHTEPFASGGWVEKYSEYPA
jgi:hypothetical protein